MWLYRHTSFMTVCMSLLKFVGLARTIYIRCVYGIFGRETTKYTVIYGVYIQFRPTLRICHRVIEHTPTVYTCIYVRVVLANSVLQIRCLSKLAWGMHIWFESNTEMAIEENKPGKAEERGWFKSNTEMTTEEYNPGKAEERVCLLWGHSVPALTHLS